MILNIGNATEAEDIERALQFFSATYSDKSDSAISLEVKYNGLKDENRYLLTFIGSGESPVEIADGVHRFMEAFFEEFYDESLEEDWLCELGCDELPSIIDYDVKAARTCRMDN